MKAEVSATVENGYARLVFQFAEEIEAQVKLANNILTINFPRPVDISIDRVSANAAGYVSAARRDPDGKGVRIALARKVTMNSMAAGERLFVDLLPDTWVGLAPGLPRDVIDDLARRAREAERRVRQQRALAQQNKAAPIRVRAITQPTFTRYVFDLPELTGVSADNTREKLTLTFDAMLRFDLADAKATLPPMIESIDSETDHDAVLVRFNFSQRVDVRTFREDNSFVVDVEPADRKTARQDGSVRSDELATLPAELAERAKAAPNVSAPKSVPARKGAPAPEQRAEPVQPPQQPQQPPASSSHRRSPRTAAARAPPPPPSRRSRRRRPQPVPAQAPPPAVEPPQATPAQAAARTGRAAANRPAGTGAAAGSRPAEGAARAAARRGRARHPRRRVPAAPSAPCSSAPATISASRSRSRRRRRPRCSAARIRCGWCSTPTSRWRSRR